MKILKIIGIVVAALFAGLVLIGIFAPSVPKSNGSSSTATAKTNSEPVAAFRADQCLEGVCAAPVYRELAALNWTKTGQNYKFNSEQKDRGDEFEESFLKECSAAQAGTWAGDAKDPCKAIIYAVSDIRQYLNHHIQTSAVIKQFSGNVPATCPFTKGKIEIIGDIESETGPLRVTFQFDKAGKLHVNQINKSFNVGSEATALALVEQLKTKHPYLKQLTKEEMQRESFIDYSWKYDEYLGMAPWGGKVVVHITKDKKDVSVTMTAPSTEFGSEIPAPCKVAEKPISVQ